MRRRIAILLAVLLATGMFSTGCGGTSDGASADAYDMSGSTKALESGAGFDSELGSFYADTNEIAQEQVEAPKEESVDSEYTTGRKIIYSSNISIETKNFDEDIVAIKKLVQSNGGYYESSSITGTAEYGGRYANYTARIPSAKYQAFMDSVGDIGSVTSSDEAVEDITSNYVDVQARLKSLRTKLERLQELEANAETVEDLLNIEDRINDVQYDIENYTAQLKVLDDKIDYCTVSIHVDEVITYTEIKADTFWNRFVEAIGDSLSGFVTFLQGLVIVIVYILPYAIVGVIIAGIVLFMIKKKGTAPKKLHILKKDKTHLSNSGKDETNSN
ncbi:protein of unknown function [Pseudobutyrivibrio sp. 49]|uniref:DUF4349 domain-containing protein n=1 Tax=Pseudobutyrivibrio sp. 49 TaxID=1855344 RepID=UPI00088CACFA|nr:DUF4349 domain-containing protein [Pseudobutyrivibrio sp. 49]SDH28058.1 protein of unknown function [Pseudobutyrivibrio sp. 49]